jgi:hypothetical protein
MKRAILLAGGAAALFSAVAVLAAPESLLPPGFDNPPSPSPAPRVRPAPAPTVVPANPSSTSSPVIQPIPGLNGEFPSGVALPEDFPSIKEIEQMSPEEIDELLGLKPKFDLPSAARRALLRVGVIARDEGGFPARSLAGQPASLVRAALKAARNPLVSRWGHILMRRALASRLDAPAGMSPVEFAALRAAALNSIGESYVARALVQDVDSSNYNTALTNAAFDAYVATGDIVGMCPVARLKGSIRQDPEWRMVTSICDSYSGDAREASRELTLALSRGIAPRIDVLLAQRYAGAAAEGGKAVNIEWEGVDELNPWRYSLAVALGVEVPSGLRSGADLYYDRAAALSPALGLADRAAAAEVAGSEGILSSAAMVDLYGQIFADSEVTGDARSRAAQLREAYVAQTPEERLAAISSLWSSGAATYGQMVLTAYAAARIPPNEDMVSDAPRLIAAMLSAGLDRNALRWGSVVPEASEGWALLVLAQPRRSSPVDSGALDNFIEDDASGDKRKSKFLLAGLAGLGRLESDAVNDASRQLGVNLARQSPWSRTIAKAADVDNPALVAMLAGLGMQGDGWDKMTARQLYLIVRSLDRVGLSAEARMIAAEAVARG